MNVFYQDLQNQAGKILFNYSEYSNKVIRVSE